jgi:hypothetical protein
MTTEFSIADLKNKHFDGFCAANGIKAVDPPEVKDSETAQEMAVREAAEATNGRFVLLKRFTHELEEDWNMEHRDELRKSDCPKMFTAADVRRFGGVEEKPADDAPQSIKDRAAFADYLETVPDEAPSA